MKKALALVLVLILCLSLSACSQPERYPHIADMLDAGDYQGAIMAIYALYHESNITESTEPAPTLDPEIPRKYTTLTNALESLAHYQKNNYSLSSFSFGHYNGEEHIYYSGFEAVAWLYHTAVELGDYENAAEIVSRFTVLEGVSLEKRYWYEDVLGNITESSTVTYFYGEDGTLINQTEDPYAISDNLPFNYGTPEYTYDENGQVTAVRYRSGETVNCVIEYSYNADGTLAAEHYLDRNGDEYNITYTYENSQIIRSFGSPYYVGGVDTATTEYFYDEAGRLVRQETIRDSWNPADWAKEVSTLDYTYDEAGRLISVRKATEYYQRYDWDSEERYLSNYNDVRIWEFTYDDTGRLIRNTYSSIGTISADGIPVNDSYRTYIGDTTYGTYYIYIPAESE